MSTDTAKFFILNAARKRDEVLEPVERKRSRPVLRGERGRKPPDLLGEDNADAHLKRSVMGREVVVAVTGGKLDLGTSASLFLQSKDSLLNEDDFSAMEASRKISLPRFSGAAYPKPVQS